jgi:hypothetical protein
MDDYTVVDCNDLKDFLADDIKKQNSTIEDYTYKKYIIMLV